MMTRNGKATLRHNHKPTMFNNGKLRNNSEAAEATTSSRGGFRLFRPLSAFFRLYYDGFRQMTLGRTLWLVIAVKLFIIFAILKVFFFPNFLKEHAPQGQEADFVATQLNNRISN